MPQEPYALDPDELDAHVVWLRRLAFSLVRDEQAADDLAQETWLKAVERRPSTDRPIRPWLATVVRNLARLRRRSAVRRGPHGSIEEGDVDSPAAVDVVARAESARRLVDAVLGLDEPFRTTVLLRYAERLSGAEIARRTGVPEGTVRWRLKRGIDTLRGRLDDDGDRGERKLGALLLPAALRPPIVPASFAVGGAFMAVKIVAVAAAALLLVGSVGWLVLRGEGTTHAPPPSGEVSVAAGSAVQRERPMDVAPETSWTAAPVRAATESERGVATAGSMVLHVVDSDGHVLAGARVTLAVEGDDDEFELTGTTVTADDGGAAPLPVDRSSEPVVYVEHAGYAPRVETLTPKGDADPVVVLRRAGSLFGVVRTFETLAPIAGARVTVGPRTTGPGSPLESVTDRQGRYRYEGAPVGEEVRMIVRREGYRPHRQDAQIDGTGETRLDIHVPVGRTLRGVVVDAETRRPIAGAVVYAARDLVTDDEGRFVLRGLVEETPYFEVRAPGYCMTQLLPPRESIDDAGEVVFPMVRGCDVQGEVRDAEGRPWPGVDIRVAIAGSSSEAPPRSAIHPGLNREGMRVQPARGAEAATTDAQGRFFVTGLPPGRSFRVETSTADRRIRLASDVFSFRRPGERHEVVLVEPALGAVEGTVTPSEPAPSAIRWSGPTSYGYAHVTPGEPYRIDEVEAGRVDLELRSGTVVVASVPVLVSEGRTTRHDFGAPAPGSVVAGVVRALDGAPFPGVDVHLYSEDPPAVISAARTDTRGRFELSAPVGVALAVEYDWTLTRFLVRRTVRAGDDDLVLLLPRPATPTLRIVDADTGVPLPRVLVGWRIDAGGRTLAPRTPKVWRPGAGGAAPHRLPVGAPTLVLDASLLGYPVTEVESFLVEDDGDDGDDGGGVKELRLQRRR